MKIGIILRFHKMKTLSGCMMTSVLLWLYWMIVEEYMLGCWMDECVWLECILCGVWWPLKMGQMGWKMDFDGRMGFAKLEIIFDGLWIPFHGSLARSLMVFVCRSIMFKIFRIAEVHLFFDKFQLWFADSCYEWVNLWDVVGGYLCPLFGTSSFSSGHMM